MTSAGGSARRVVALAALMFAGFSFVTVEIAPVGLLPAVHCDGMEEVEGGTAGDPREFADIVRITSIRRFRGTFRAWKSK